MKEIFRDQEDQERFRVLRFVPITPVLRSGEDDLMAKIDLIEPRINLLLFDCELRLGQQIPDAYVQIPDQTVLLRYFLEPGFSGEIDFDALLRQLDFAVRRHLSLPMDSDGYGEILVDFLESPRWEEWVEAHPTELTLLEAIRAYARCG
jgi:hypothetical protein